MPSTSSLPTVVMLPERERDVGGAMSVRWSAADADRSGLRMFAMALLPRVTLLRRRRTR